MKAFDLREIQQKLALAAVLRRCRIPASAVPRSALQWVCEPVASARGMLIPHVRSATDDALMQCHDEPGTMTPSPETMTQKHKIMTHTTFKENLFDSKEDQKTSILVQNPAGHIWGGVYIHYRHSAWSRWTSSLDRPTQQGRKRRS